MAGDENRRAHMKKLRETSRVVNNFMKGPVHGPPAPGRTAEFDAGHGKDEGDDYLAAVRRQAQTVMDYEKNEGRPMGEGSKYQGYNDQPITKPKRK